MLVFGILLGILLFPFNSFGGNISKFDVSGESPASFFSSGISGYYLTEEGMKTLKYQAPGKFNENSEAANSENEFGMSFNENGTVVLIRKNKNYSCPLHENSNCVLSNPIIEEIEVTNLTGKINADFIDLNNEKNNNEFINFKLGSKLYTLKLRLPNYDFNSFKDFDSLKCISDSSGKCVNFGRKGAHYEQALMGFSATQTQDDEEAVFIKSAENNVYLNFNEKDMVIEELQGDCITRINDEKPETMEVYETAENKEPIETAEVAETSENKEPIETAEVAETSENNETIETVQVAETAENKKPIETAEVAETAENKEPIETVQVAETAENKEPIETTQVAETSENKEPIETAEVAETSENKEPIETAEVAETSENNETIETAEVSETSENKEPIETAEVAETSENKEPIETAEVSEAAMAPEKFDTFKTTETTDSCKIKTVAKVSKKNHPSGMTYFIIDYNDKNIKDEIYFTDNNGYGYQIFLNNETEFSMSIFNKTAAEIVYNAL